MYVSNEKNGYPRARIVEVDGKLVLEDPEAMAVISVVNKRNCKISFDKNLDRIDHFKKRMEAHNKNPEEMVIIILSVDDVYGGALTDILMPNFNWQEIRDRGEKPFARGLASRNFIQQGLNLIDKEAAKKLKETEGMVAVVFDFGVAEVFKV